MMMRVRALLRSIPVLWLNTCIAFLVVNLLIATYWFVFPKEDSAITVYGTKLSVTYPDMNVAEARLLLKETWSRPLIYDAYTDFRERPYHGKYVNVSDQGFRYSADQGPWPPDRKTYFTVFLFGGSTTFGYGVADNDTLASYLQRALPASGKEVKIYNFGVGSYYSTQERILFERLLVAGFVPDMAIFVDGLNEFFQGEDMPALGWRLQELGDSSFWRELLRVVPLTNVAVDFKRNVLPAMQPRSEESWNDTDRSSIIIRRYFGNKEIIDAAATRFGVRPVFVWHAVPTYHYDLSLHPFPSEMGRVFYTKYGYPMMEEALRRRIPDPKFVWCADVHKDIKEVLYLDNVHFTPKMNQIMAKCIADGIPQTHEIPNAPLPGNDLSQLSN